METAGADRLTALTTGGGCAAKYPAARLRELLAGFLSASSEDLLVGLEAPDDAAVYRLDEERALVCTVDFFPPLVEDPALFGRIAAANALSDVFAMGGAPLLALAVATFPEQLELAVVRAILDAASATVREAGALLAGGHTLRDDQPRFGLAVIGTVHPAGIWRKQGAQPGDALYLTKPLGTGLVLTAAKRGVLGQRELAAAAASMSELNQRAAETLRPFEPHAVTDVTGFGLFGHANELAAASGVRLRIDAAALPWLPGARAAAEQGLATGGDGHNRASGGDAVDVRGADPAVALLGFDPQTSGGLLVALPADKGSVLEATFVERGLFLARIGEVAAGSGITVQ